MLIVYPGFLNKKMIEQQNILNYIEVENLIQRFNSGESFLYNRIWCLIILNKFLFENESLFNK